MGHHGVEKPRRRDDLIKPFLRTTVDGLDIMGDPSVDRLTIEGPRAATGPGDSAFAGRSSSATPDFGRSGPTSKATPPRRRRSACATRILSSLARVAYRRPVDQQTVATLMGFYRRGRPR